MDSIVHSTSCRQGVLERACLRFAGLLVVTHLLPDAQPELLGRVYDAIGQQFFARLLLPLTRTAVSLLRAPDRAQTVPCGPRTK